MLDHYGLISWLSIWGSGQSCKVVRDITPQPAGVVCLNMLSIGSFHLSSSFFNVSSSLVTFALKYLCVISCRQVDEPDVEDEEGKEAEAEEKRWSKRSQQMLSALNRYLHRHDSVTFRQMAPPSSVTSNRKQAAAKFYTFLVLKKTESIEVRQDVPYGDISISRGVNFESLG